MRARARHGRACRWAGRRWARRALSRAALGLPSSLSILQHLARTKHARLAGRAPAKAELHIVTGPLQGRSACGCATRCTASPSPLQPDQQRILLRVTLALHKGVENLPAGLLVDRQVAAAAGRRQQAGDRCWVLRTCCERPMCWHQANRASSNALLRRAQLSAHADEACWRRMQGPDSFLPRCRWRLRLVPPARKRRR